jgi:hypothetical protein
LEHVKKRFISGSPERAHFLRAEDFTQEEVKALVSALILQDHIRIVETPSLPEASQKKTESDVKKTIEILATAVFERSQGYFPSFPLFLFSSPPFSF